ARGWPIANPAPSSWPGQRVGGFGSRPTRRPAAPTGPPVRPPVHAGRPPPRGRAHPAPPHPALRPATTHAAGGGWRGWPPATPTDAGTTAPEPCRSPT